MAALERTISKAISIVSSEILKDKELFFRIMEDLSPELIKERSEMEKMYSNEIGKLLLSAYESKEGLNGPAWKAIKGILDHDMQFKETKQEWFVKLFYRSFSNNEIIEKRQDLLRLLYKMAIRKKAVKE